MKAIHISNAGDLYSLCRWINTTKKVTTERRVCLCCSLLQTIKHHQKPEGSTVTDGNGPELVLFIFKLLNSDDIVNNLFLQRYLEGPYEISNTFYFK